LIGNVATMAIEVGYAFEASRRNIRILKSNLKRNSIKNITVLHRAVHNTNNEMVEFYIDKKETCGGNDSMYRKGGSVERVKTITIDSFYDDSKIENAAVIKIDIEGNELKALQGARKTISRFKPMIICEFNAGTAKRAGFALKELYDFIISFGYGAFVLKRGVPVGFDENNLNDTSFREDMIFIT
ncbi:MAG: FkbM family methyltransferase, partial [Candidatus Marinimicrobia bacterium]|nr:FkbM family methyltransferase [Candidatus Neomarinimicrobiota bacterium]